MFVEGKIIDLVIRTVSPKNGQNFTAFDQVHLLVKENPDRNPEKIICNPEHINGAEVGKNIKLPVYVKPFSTRSGGGGYELRSSSPTK